MIRVLIADDHNVFVEGIESLLSGSPDIEVTQRCYTAPSVEDALRQQAVDVVLLDLSFPHVDNGLALCETITQTHPRTKVIALTMHDDASLIRRVIRKGAKGYLLKNTTKAELLQAIRAVRAGEQYVNQSILQLLIQEDAQPAKAGLSRSKRPSLTPREQEVLALIAEGLTTQQMANRLFVSSKAVEFHRSNLLTKFEVSNTALLIKTAMEMQCIA